MKTSINKILVPIDDSSTAMAALKYAIAYSSINHADIDILHVYSYRFDHKENKIPNSLEELKRQKFKPIESMVSKTLDGELPEILCELGNPIDVIKEKSKNYDLIIMGSTGKHGFLDKLLGSISSGIAQHAHCPVLLVPQEQSNVNFNKTLFACQADTVDLNLLDHLFKISPDNNFNEIHFIEIVKPNKNTASKTIQQTIEEIHGKTNNDIHYFIDEIDGDSVSESLNEYANKNDIGVIVITTRHRTSLESLFHKSTTKKMVLDIKVPLLILHFGD